MAIDKEQLLKSAGEKIALIALQDVLKPLAKDLILESDNKWDDMILPFLDDIEAKLVAEIDKIDGEVG